MASLISRLLALFGWRLERKSADPIRAPAPRAGSSEKSGGGLEDGSSSLQSAPIKTKHVSIAAFHEAGHCVLAHVSQFHGVAPGPITLGSYGSGAAHVMLRKSALALAGMPVEESSTAHPDVASDLAVVLVAGLAAERIAQSKYSWLAADVQSADPDYRKARADLARAGVATNLAIFEELATQKLARHWQAVERIAETLAQKNTIEGLDVVDILAEEIG
jgi:hypothetical protein